MVFSFYLNDGSLSPSRRRRGVTNSPEGYSFGFSLVPYHEKLQRRRVFLIDQAVFENLT